jgi:hypothetical protein
MVPASIRGKTLIQNLGREGKDMRDIPPRFIALASFFTLPALVVLQGCAAGKEARDLASQLRQLTAQYQSLSTAKIEAERQFYLDALKGLDYTLNVVDPTGSEDKQPDVTKTIAYGRIIMEANTDSLELAETLVKGRDLPITAGTIAEFVRDGLSDEEQAFLQARQTQSEVTKVLVVDFARLKESQNKLSALLKELAELEKPSSQADRITQLRAIGEAVRKQLQQADTK